jgi:hypothetical protein
MGRFVVLKKLIFVQLIKKSSPLNGSQRFVIVFRRAVAMKGNQHEIKNVCPAVELPDVKI